MSSRTSVKNVRATTYGTQGRAKAAKEGSSAKRSQAMAQNRANIMYQSPSALVKRGVDVLFATPTIATDATTNSSSWLLNPVQEGNAIQNRLNRKIRMTSLRVRGEFGFTTATPAGAVVGNSVRMLIIYDRTPQNDIPVINQIVAATGENGTESLPSFGPVWCNVRLDNQDRFKVLRDMIVPYDGITTTTYAGGILNFKCIDEYIKLPADCQEAAYTTTFHPLTVSAIQTGALYMILRATVNDGNNAATFRGTTRLRFY